MSNCCFTSICCRILCCESPRSEFTSDCICDSLARALFLALVVHACVHLRAGVCVCVCVCVGGPFCLAVANHCGWPSLDLASTVATPLRAWVSPALPPWDAPVNMSWPVLTHLACSGTMPLEMPGLTCSNRQVGPFAPATDEQTWPPPALSAGEELALDVIITAQTDLGTPVGEHLYEAARAKASRYDLVPNGRLPNGAAFAPLLVSATVPFLDHHAMVLFERVIAPAGARTDPGAPPTGYCPAVNGDSPVPRTAALLSFYRMHSI